MTEEHLITFESIDSDLIAKWQGIADLLAKIISVPAALIMKTEDEHVEVLVASKTDNNPYHPGDKDKWQGNYCETVIKTQKELLVPNATTDSHWNKNPDIKRGMIAFLGYPINFPDQTPFGTLCVLDDKENDFLPLHKQLLLQFRDTIEMDIALLKKDALRNQAEARLKSIEWMLSPKKSQDPVGQAENQYHYGDLTKLNSNGIILKSVGHDHLNDIANDYMELLGTSSAIYEKNGDYAFGIFSSSWCRMMDCASRKLCNTPDNAEALNSGKWLCHESCWTDCSRIAIAEGKPTDIECNGGIRMYCEPVFANNKVVGSINFGYGDPPKERVELQKLADLYHLEYDELVREAHSYESRPPFIVEMAKKRLHGTARLIGTVVEKTLSEEKIRDLARFPDENSNPVFRVAKDMILLYCNSAAAEFIAVDGIQVGDKIPSVWHDSIKEAWNAGKRTQVEVELGERTLLFNRMPIKEHGYINVYALDITERKQAKELLQISELRYRNQASFLDSVIENSPFAMWISDEKGMMIRANQSLRNILNVTDDMIIDKYNVLHDENLRAQKLLHVVEAVFNDLKSARFTMFWTGTKAGNADFSMANELWIDVSIFPIADEAGTLSNVVCQYINITGHKQSEQALEAEKERLAVTLRSIGDGVITTDTNGNIVLLNKTAEELTGWLSTEAAGKPLAEVFNIINELTRRQCENPVVKVLATGNVVELANHTALVTRDNREIVIADSAAPIKNANNETIGVVLVFRDMTEKKKLESTIEVSSRLESLGVLAGGIAHDFNNLLGGIYGYIDMAIESAEDDTTSEYLSKTISTIERTRALTQQLLTFAKGGAPIRKVAPLFPFVQETAQFALSGSNVSCDFDVQQDLWNCNYDSSQVGQVIDNLIINAQQAMPVGGTITVSARNISLAEKEHPLLGKGDFVRVSIKDSGVGIPKELLIKIFDPFFTTKTKGHGLGLATCYSIINRHGGCINVYSEQGKGSVFHVYLPAAEESVTDINRKTVKQYKGSGTFLVMDDEEVMQETISDMLSSLGYTVVCKENGKDAVGYVASELNAERLLSGIIFDLTVPGGMGGKEAVAQIRQLNAGIPVFVASGYADDPVMRNPEEYGFTASIGKPFRRIELIEMLEKHMNTGS